MRYARSIRFRLTAWYALFLTAGLALFGTLIWISLRHQMIQEVDRDLAGRAARFEKFFREESADAATPLRDELSEFCQALSPGSYLAVHSSSFDFRYPATAPPNSDGTRTLKSEFAFNGEKFELETRAPIGNLLHTLDLLRLQLWSLIPLVILIACAGGAWLSARALRPVRDVTEAARAISIRNLSGRVPVPHTGDELDALAYVLNAMLTRLEMAVRTLSQFVADASHELRTPLAVIRTTAELALRRERTAESYRESLESVVAEASRMTELVENLLTLARSEAGTVEMPLELLDVRDVVREVAREMSGLAEVRSIRLNTILGEEPRVVSGNRPALHRLFVLLLDNALKFSPTGTEVAMRVGVSESGTFVATEDAGPGMSDQDLPHIFERFYRADHARTGGGHGLGLALAHSIAKLHSASIEVRNRAPGGCSFTVVFPTAAGSFSETSASESTVKS